jgi:murein DD-endopeptidase MepM/ murein hydrolase activator NlpD
MNRIGKKIWGRKVSSLFWSLLGLCLLAALLWLGLGRMDLDDPWVNLKTPVEVVGAKTPLALEAGDQTSGLREVRVTLKQGEQEKLVISKTFPPGGEPGTAVEVPFTLEPQTLGFQEGKARLTIEARDRSWRNWFRGRSRTLTREVVIDLVPIQLVFQSVSHLLRPGGTGLICYRLNKGAKESGVQAGNFLYQGYPNPKGGKDEYVCLFPVPQEAPGGTVPVELVARPASGNEARQKVTLKLKPKRWRHDKMDLSEDFLRRVAASFPVTNPGDLTGAYLQVNRELRQKNHARVRQVCTQSKPQPLWSGAFQRYLGKPMARFGDRRTYIYQGQQIDQQVHLGEDLASLVHSPVPAANKGEVVLAESLGIYGQTVILDHGLGVFSMYSHLSQIEVKVGREVNRGDVLGRTGNTGLAGGDHLHFAMIIQGEFVNPLEWWDPHWLKDQVEGQWARAGAPAPEAGAEAKPAGETKGKKKSGKSKGRPGKSRQQSRVGVGLEVPQAG